MIKAVFFDLDGTLADTAPDLADALNRLLIERQRPPLPFERIRPVVSHGGNAMIQLGFGVDNNHPDFAGLRERFLEIYSGLLHHATRLFPGISETLEALEAQSMTWGIITNKPDWLTRPLLRTLGLDSRAGCVVSGDSTAERKPHPAPMYRACELTHSHPAMSLYIGDAERDIAAGRAAGMRTLVALYGYIGADEQPGDWGADGMIKMPQEIMRWIAESSRTS